MRRRPAHAGIRTRDDKSMRACDALGSGTQHSGDKARTPVAGAKDPARATTSSRVRRSDDLSKLLRNHRWRRPRPERRTHRRCASLRAAESERTQRELSRLSGQVDLVRAAPRICWIAVSSILDYLRIELLDSVASALAP